MLVKQNTGKHQYKKTKHQLKYRDRSNLMKYLGVADAGADLGLELVFSSSCNRKTMSKHKFKQFKNSSATLSDQPCNNAIHDFFYYLWRI